MADILNLCVHKFYYMVQYLEQKAGFPLPKSNFGRFLGPCHNNSDKLTMNIMTENGSIVPCRTIIPLTMAEMNMPDAKRQCVIFDNIIREKHRDSMNLPPWQMEANEKRKDNDCSFIPYKDDESEPHLIPENDVIDMNVSLVDAFVNADIIFSKICPLCPLLKPLHI